MWFTNNDQISWQHPATEQSTERAAHQFWVRNATQKQKVQEVSPLHSKEGGILSSPHFLPRYNAMR